MHLEDYNSIENKSNLVKQTFTKQDLASNLVYDKKEEVFFWQTKKWFPIHISVAWENEITDIINIRNALNFPEFSNKSKWSLQKELTTLQDIGDNSKRQNKIRKYLSSEKKIQKYINRDSKLAYIINTDTSDNTTLWYILYSQDYDYPIQLPTWKYIHLDTIETLIDKFAGNWAWTTAILETIAHINSIWPNDWIILDYDTNNPSVNWWFYEQLWFEKIWSFNDWNKTRIVLLLKK